MLANNPNSYPEILIRLGLALLAGIILGLNRWMHHKSAGIRTHSLVALGAALVMLLVGSFPGTDVQAHSRVLQGLITGIGFLGAGRHSSPRPFPKHPWPYDRRQHLGLRDSRSHFRVGVLRAWVVRDVSNAFDPDCGWAA